MSSTSMPPPPTPLSHRRSNRLVNHPSSKLFPASPELPPCLPKMSLSKGATFHHSSSPPSDDDPLLSIHHLARRSPTCSQSMLASWLSDKKDIAQSLADFEETFSGARGKRLSSRRRSAQEFEQQLKVHRASISSDEGIGSSISSASDKSLSRKFERALDLLDKDSGLGTSISDQESVRRGQTNEDATSPTNLMQDANSPAPAARQTRQRQLGNKKPSSTSTSAVTQSIAPPTSKKSSKPSSLSSLSKRKINKYIFAPILQEERFEAFHPLVSTLSSKGNKNIRCLRDIEQSLIFQPLTLSLSPQHYRAFGEFSIQLVVDTYQQIPESEQRRAADRPYDNGYFLDLVQQVGRLAAQIGPNRQPSESAEDDEFAYSPDDEITLEGGLGSTGEVAELVRWKNGQGISLRTGEMYHPTPGIKREASSMLDDDAARSMARRKKGYIPEIVEMKCSDPTCDKIFTRKCDLAKHEKTHSRPFKCPHPTCKYNELGLPTEKERDRHMNDKHDPNPKYYQCEYCEFRTKRESNCKQHMEKKHGWEYQRAKGKDKGAKMTPAQTPQTPAVDYTSSKQSPAVSYISTNWEDASSMAGSIAGPHSAQLTPYDQPMSAFEGYAQAPTYNAPLFPRNANDQFQQMDDADFNFNNWAPGQSYLSPVNSHPNMTTPVTPAYSNITGQSPFLRNMDVNMDLNNTGYDNYNSLPTPESFLQPHSRNPSISHQSPMYDNNLKFDDNSNMYDADVNFNDPVIGGNLSIPDNDFDLFSGQASSNNAFSNQAAASATLFPASQFAALDNDPILDAAYDEGFVDYSMTN